MAVKNILDTIVQDTREFVRERRLRVDEHGLRDLPGFSRTTVDLAAALRCGRLAIIAECKQASPSQGIIRTGFDPAGIARSYDRAGADALSVLTEPTHFRGSLADLESARRETALPILRKDFIVDRYQLVEARAHGADAVLLIASVLSPSELKEFHAEATELGLSCLVECHERAELDGLDLSAIRILGVNNRDLRTFVVDRDHAARVLADVPAGIVRVAESGLKSAEDLAAVRRAGLDAVLIGETFMRAPDPGRALDELRMATERLLAPGTEVPRS